MTLLKRISDAITEDDMVKDECDLKRSPMWNRSKKFQSYYRKEWENKKEVLYFN